MDFRSKRTQTKEHNRRVILDAARGVFGREGYRTATVRDIINATPLASGTFYNYFRSKEDVYAALRDEIALEVRPCCALNASRLKRADDFVAGTFRAFLSHADAAPQSARPRSMLTTTNASAGTRTIVMGGDDLRQDIQVGHRTRLVRGVGCRIAGRGDRRRRVRGGQCHAAAEAHGCERAPRGSARN